jgi:hypothetical protein
MAGDAWNKILHPACILSIPIPILADQLEVYLIPDDLQTMSCLYQNIPRVSGPLRCNADEKTTTYKQRNNHCIKQVQKMTQYTPCD